MPNRHADEALDFSWHMCSTFSAVFANTRFQEVVTDARCQLQFDVSHTKKISIFCVWQMSFANGTAANNTFRSRRLKKIYSTEHAKFALPSWTAADLI